LFERELARGESPAYARTVVVSAFVIIEVFCLFSSRSHRRAIWQMSPFSNRWLIAGVAAMIALQLLFTYAPMMNAVFHSVPISLRSWAAVIAVGLAAMAAVEFEKAIGGRR
jgi:cation-transporting ATPase F